MKFQTVNPATEEVLQTYETMPRQEVLEIARRSHRAFQQWRDLPVAERAPLFVNLAGVLRHNKEKYARLISLEMGKTITEARGEVEKCAWLSEFYAEAAPAWLTDETVSADGRRHVIAFEPLGVIFSIMPWNYPFWQALRFGVPTVIAGNTSILKHASNVSGCGLAIAEAFTQAGFPPDVFRTVLADHETVAAIIADDLVRGVSLTGSTGAGQRVGEAAGAQLKKVVLELGGSDPFIVLEDADVEFAARNAVTGRMISAGQSCIAAKRFIVVRKLAEPFSERFAAGMKTLRTGDPLDEQTQVGAIVNREALEDLERQLRQSVEMGARVIAGGERLGSKGFFLAPTVVTDVTSDMPVAREEVFGPIAPILVVEDEDEAVALANDSEFGLGASVWTRDPERGERVARRLEAGTTFVNSIVKSDPRMPFGGVKQSGIGRELSRFGLREFVNIKGINVYDHGRS
jgi:succinate-semialdehyde dehydrogenase/glutarate-semialdehyde dehydrogenase